MGLQVYLSCVSVVASGGRPMGGLTSARQRNFQVFAMIFFGKRRRQAERRERRKKAEKNEKQLQKERAFQKRVRKLQRKRLKLARRAQWEPVRE